MSQIPTLAQTWRAGTGVAGLLFSASHASPDAVFIEDRHGSVLTFSEAEGQVRALAGFLSRKGVKRGDRVTIYFQNRAEIAIALFAVAQARRRNPGTA